MIYAREHAVHKTEPEGNQQEGASQRDRDRCPSREGVGVAHRFSGHPTALAERDRGAPGRRAVEGSPQTQGREGRDVQDKTKDRRRANSFTTSDL